MTRRFAFPVVARDVLRAYWGSALLILAAGAVALAAVTPLLRLAGVIGPTGSRLRFSTIRASDLGFLWGPNASTPSGAQSDTVALLLQLLVVAACATLVLAAITILSISASRASTRSPELAVRRAVGASRRSLLAAALAEGGAIGTLTLGAGVGAGMLGLLAAMAGWPGEILPGSFWPAALAVAGTGLVIVTGALFQLFAAAPRRVRESDPQPVALSIPAVQLGMGLTVLVASAMLIRHAARLAAPAGAAAGHGMVVELASPDSSVIHRARQYEALLTELRQKGTIRTASVMSPGALVGLGNTDAITTDCGYCPEGGVFIKWHLAFTTHYFVSPDSFEALGLERVEGRLLTEFDRWNTMPVAVISESLARRHFQYGQALGRQVLLQLEGPVWYTVVGVVKDREARAFGAAMQPRYAIYLSVLQRAPNQADLLLRPATPASAATVKRALGGHFRGATSPPVAEAAIVARETRPLTWFGRWFAVLGWAMLLITAAGTFVLMRLWVRSLRAELGLHRAAGARRVHLLRYILGRAALTGMAGAAIAAWFGPALWDTLPEMVGGMPPWNLRLVAPLVLVLLAIALAGALFPAIRAIRETPIQLLGSPGE